MPHEAETLWSPFYPPVHYVPPQAPPLININEEVIADSNLSCRKLRDFEPNALRPRPSIQLQLFQLDCPQLSCKPKAEFWQPQPPKKLTLFYSYDSYTALLLRGSGTKILLMFEGPAANSPRGCRNVEICRPRLPL